MDNWQPLGEADRESSEQQLYSMTRTMKLVGLVLAGSGWVELVASFGLYNLGMDRMLVFILGAVALFDTLLGWLVLILLERQQDKVRVRLSEEPPGLSSPRPQTQGQIGLWIVMFVAATLVSGWLLATDLLGVEGSWSPGRLLLLGLWGMAFAVLVAFSVTVLRLFQERA